MLAGRHIVLGVSGGVAAYKAAYLARRLVEAGAEVRTVMTQAAGHFLGPQTLAAITGTAPILDLFDDPGVSPHTDLAAWADAVVVAPATAATISRLASGLSEDALSSTVLATRAVVCVAPAMHTEMWEHPATRANIVRLQEFGYRIVPPETGPLAGGDVGVGRLAEPDVILAAVVGLFEPGGLSGIRVLITGGGTREPIDPVRYVGNRSSGKMANALAEEAARRGAEVTLVTAAEPPAGPGIDVVPVDTADEMAAETWQRAGEADVAIMAAAVSDFRPSAPETSKIRRADGTPTLELEPTPDVLAGVASSEPRPFVVGFAAETGSIEEAVAKAKRKDVDLLVANDVSKAGSGFGSETNEVTLVYPDGTTEPWGLASKVEVAARLWDLIIAMRGGAER